MQRIRFPKTAVIAAIAAVIAISAVAGAQLILSDGMGAGGVLGQPDLNTPAFTVGTPYTLSQVFDRQPVTQDSLWLPGDAAYDDVSHYLYVADTFNNRVVVRDVTNGFTDSPVVFVLGQSDFTSFGENAQVPSQGCTTAVNACGIIQPWNVVIVTSGSTRYLAVTDFGNHRVLLFNVSDANVNGEAAVKVLGQPDFVSAVPQNACGGGASGANACGMNGPYSLMFEPIHQTLLVSGFDSRLVFFDLSAGITNGMAASRELGQPDMTTDGGDNAPCGGPVGTHDGNACGIYYVSKMAWDHVEGVLYVPTFHNVHAWKYSPDANLATAVTNGAPATWVIGQPTFADPASPTYGGGPLLADPQGLAVDPVGRKLFIADTYNCRVAVYDIAGGARAKTEGGIAPTNVIGWPSLTAGGRASGADPNFCGRLHDNGDGTFTWNQTAATATNLEFPTGVVWDNVGGRLFVVDQGINRLTAYGSLVNGIPVQVTGGTSTTVANPDGSTSVTVAPTGGGSIGVTLPAGTGPNPGTTQVQVTVDPGNGAGKKPAIAINASLPPGTSKTVTLAYAFQDLCINDVPNATIALQSSCSGVRVKKQDLSAVGSCVTWEQSDTVCHVGSSIVVNGLENSALFFVQDSDDDGFEDDVDRCPNTDLAGPVPLQSLRPNAVGDDVVQKFGCNCSQILDCKKGSDTGEKKFGCSAGTINVWNKGIGWAKACQ